MVRGSFLDGADLAVSVICGSHATMNVEGRVILASKSPRRVEILKNELGLKNVEIIPSQFQEDLNKDMYAPFEYPVQTAIRKALDVYQGEVDADEPPSLLLAADTVLEMQGQTLEKPRGIDHHVAMLKSLRDSPYPHKVYTGVAVIVPFEKPVIPGYALETYLGISEVTFRKDITDQEIIDYVASGEAKDAAGGYKIQGEGGMFVENVKGDKFNVIGLPVDGTRELIEKAMRTAEDSDSELENE